MDEGDMPTTCGKMLGDALALIAAAGRRDMPPDMKVPEMCLTCAFREGTLPNRMAGTGKLALDCIIGIDRFACHHSIKNGEPQRICAGFYAAMVAPFSFVKEVITSVHNDLAALDDAAADPVREDYICWLASIDPERKMDVYQIARAYAQRDDLPRPTTEAERALTRCSATTANIGVHDDGLSPNCTMK